MNTQDQKEIVAFESYLQYHIDQRRKYADQGIIYGSASFTDMDLCGDEVARRLNNNERIEDFVPELYKEGWEMSVFEGEIN